MKMKIPVRRSCITLIVLSAFVEAITANENETSTVAGRKGRVSGRIIKLYSGYKPDPVICIEEGFKADPVHCSVFYRCLKSSSGKFTVFKFQCGPGTVYDPETEVCNHPSSTKRSECGGIKSHVEQDNENDIDQHELPSPISTIVPVYTSAANNNARYTTKVPQLSSSDQFKPSTENDYVNSFTSSSSPYQLGLTTKEVQDINHNLLSYPWTDYKNTSQQRITSSTCISDGFMGDTEDCKKFYRCVGNLRGGFIRYEFVCSEPTVWDDHMQSCNHPWAVRSRRCGRFGINSEMSYVSNDMATELTEGNYGVKFSETPNQGSSEISKPIEPTASYGDRLSSASEKNQMSYGPSLVDYTTTPNHDKSTETEGNIHSDDVHNNYNFGQKTTIQAIYSTNKLAANSDAQFAETGRNFICTQSGFFGDFINCKKFYRCIENGKGSFTKYEFTCSQGTVWDKKLEACNYAWAVKECGGASAVESLTTVDTFTLSTNTIPTIMSENVDNGYINHSNQEIEPSTTITVSTPVSLISSTAASNLIEKECTETGFVGDKNDCKKFYRCVENGRGLFTKFEYICGDGTLWDQNIEACNHAWAVHSCNLATPNSTLHTTRVTTAKTSVLIQSTTPAKVQENNDYNVAYGPQLDTASSTPDVDLQKTTLAPIIYQKYNCESTGFMGDSNDCKKFYRCVSNGQSGFIKYEFSCGEGTVWDPEIEACNHAWAVKNCGSSIALKDEVTSSSITYSSTKASDATVTTSISSIQTSTQPEEISDSGYGQQQIVSTKRPYLETTTLKQSYDQSNICHVSGFIGDMNNCNKFYRCVDNGNGGFIRYEFSCGEGTVWDPEIEACNHAWAVKHCGGPSKENHLTSSTTNVNQSNNEYVTQNFTETTTSTVSTVTTITVTSSSNECESSGFMGDNSDCQKFYRCVDNGNGGFVKHEFMCGEGTVWDSKIEACNHKWAVEKCGGNSHSESVKTTTHSSQPTSPVTESLTTSSLSVTYTTPTMSTHPVNIVPSNEDSGCSSEGYFANPNDCKKFYRCVTEGNDGYTKYEFSCAEGTAWDTNTQSCNYISKVQTCSSNQHQINLAETKPVHDEPITESDKTTTSASTTSTSTTSASTAPAYTSSTSTTSKSTMSASITPESTTSTPTTSANATTLTTVRQNTCKEEGYFGDTNDCKNFYRCVYENDRVLKKYDFTCGDGTIWDQDLVTCNHPHDVKNPSCKSVPESTSPVSTTSTTIDYNETNSSLTTNKPSSTTIEAASNKNDTNSNCSNSTTENPNNANVTCPKAGYYADLRNCKKFYRCVDWENNGKKFSVYHFECADGTIWDPALETCNHEDSVYPPRNCNAAQNENTTETSSTTEQTTTTTNKAESTNTSPEPTKTSAQTTTTSKHPSTQTTQSSTTEKSTSEPSTTQISTTNKSTTQSSTTQGSTTQSSTTEESTTQSSTTQESTTQSSTTQESTTQSTTTTETTTQSSSSAESTTQTSTTQSSTGEESTTQSSTTEESTTQTSTTQSSTTDEPTTQSSTTDESTTQSSTTEEPTTHSSTTEESTTQSSTTNEQTTLESQFHSTTTETDKEKTTTTQMTTSTLDQTSTTEPSTTATDASSTTEHNEESTTATSTNEKCPDTAADQSLFVCPTSFKRHPKYCNLFYQCTEDNDSHEIKIAVFNCPNNTIYDESKIQCVEEKKSSKKCDGKISQKHKVEGLGATQIDLFVVTKGSMACEYSGHFSFEKHTECSSSLLKCELTKSGHLRGFVYRCPDGFVYWNISRRCEPLKKVRDCKRSSYQWERRYDIPLERFNIAS